jgi:hypothetical protein
MKKSQKNKKNHDIVGLPGLLPLSLSHSSPSPSSCAHPRHAPPLPISPSGCSSSSLCFPFPVGRLLFLGPPPCDVFVTLNGLSKCTVVAPVSPRRRRHEHDLLRFTLSSERRLLPRAHPRRDCPRPRSRRRSSFGPAPARARSSQNRINRRSPVPRRCSRAANPDPLSFVFEFRHRHPLSPRTSTPPACRFRAPVIRPLVRPKFDPPLVLCIFEIQLATSQSFSRSRNKAERRKSVTPLYLPQSAIAITCDFC